MALGGIYRPRLGAVAGPSSPTRGLTWLRRLSFLAAALLVGEAVYIVFHSPRLAVTGVEVRGDAAVAGEVAAKIHLPANTNIFLAPTGKLVALAKSLPSVREAGVRRDLHRRLILTVERREAAAVIRAEKQAMLIDPNGVVFTVRNEWGWGLPELAAPHLSASDIGSAAAKSELAELLHALRALGPNPRLRITRVVMDRHGELELILEPGARVRLGSTDHLQAKAKLLATILEQLPADRIEFLDLHDPLTAYWRQRTPPRPKVSAPR